MVPTAPAPHGRKGKVSTKEKASQKKTPSNAAICVMKPSKKLRNSGKSYAKGFTTDSDDGESTEVAHNPMKKKQSHKGRRTPIPTKTMPRRNGITPPTVGKKKSSSPPSKELPKKAHQMTAA